MKYKVISAFCLGLLTVGMLQTGELQAEEGNRNQRAAVETQAVMSSEETKESEVVALTAIAASIQQSVSGQAASVGQTASQASEEPETAEPIAAETPGTIQSIAAESVAEVLEENIQEQPEENEYADLAIANVTNYVNVRSQPNTDSEIVGKIDNGAVAQILEVAGQEEDWFKVVSGNVEGYIKSEFFLYGEAAAAVIDDYVTRYAVVMADRLNVRESPDLEAKRIGYIDNGEKVKIVENQGDWIQVQYTDSKTGYVAAEYVMVSEEFVYAKTLEEEAAELAARKALEARQNVSEEATSENVNITVSSPTGDYSSNAELRSGIIDYAMQFLGNKYVHGGNSLETGTDCSGFTSLIYAQFGYAVSRTPSGQLSSDGRSVSYSEIQPGDIICYGSGGKCTHVALYIGDGQIIHSANSRKGVVIYEADYDTILDIKNVID